MLRPFRDKRPIGPFAELIKLNETTSEQAFKTEEDIQRVAEQLVRRTPGIIRESKLNDFFEVPTFYIDFILPSNHPMTFSREHFSSSISAAAQTGNIREMSIRFPAIKVTDTNMDSVQEFTEDIAPEIYRVRIVLQDEVDDGEPEFHPHVHYSTKFRDGVEGPPLQEEARKLNRMIRQWYANVDQLFN